MTVADGFYGVHFDGAGGGGVAVVALQGGRVSGADAAGVTYDGTYSVQADGTQLDVMATVLPGIPLATGVPAQARTYSFPIHTMMPTPLSGAHAFAIGVPGGQVTATLRKLRDL